MCHHLNVSKAGYYAWRQRKPSTRRRADAKLLRKIRKVHQKSRSHYGRPRIHADLRGEGIRVSGKRIARLMRWSGIRGKKRRRSKAASSSPGTIPAAPNRLNRRFSVRKPNRAWVSDITYFPTKQGWLYLAVVIDCYSRRVVGWAADKRIDATLALGALKMALYKRPYHKLIVHTDRGSQFACREYAQFLKACGVTASMSRKGNCWDNAIAESFFASMKVELKPDQAWKTRAKARAEIFEYIEAWYNPQRRHSANRYLSPIAYENRYVI